ncbi:MAG: BMP family ABC transporter substrate-binding protein [Faecousia sp.]
MEGIIMRQMAIEEYTRALRQGTKEVRECVALGRREHPQVLDELLPENYPGAVVDLGVMEIPSNRIIGTKTAGRITAFSPSFHPLLPAKTEFAMKWINLCEAHLGETGIQDPIQCFEYLGNFYVQEGNKRVSVLRHFGSPRIPSYVRRVVPPVSDEPRIKAYYEFLDFYKVSRLYTVQFRRPGDYAKLLSHLGRKSDEVWSEEDRRNFNAYYHYFQDAFEELNTRGDEILCEEALLLWLELYPYQDLGRLTGTELKATLSALWEDVLSTSREDSVKVETRAEDGTKANIIERIISLPDHLNIAFVHQLTEAESTWVASHEEGRRHLEDVFGDKITCNSYFNASNAEQAELAIETAVAEGAQVVFTTSPPLSRATLKAAVAHPKVRFFNCSVSQPFSSIRTYYARIYEAKFITGAIAGAMAQNNRIGYVTSYPIFGVPASINAFALGAQMTNPRAQVELGWTCLPGTPQADFFADGIRVISNRSVPTPNQMNLDFCNYGTYMVDDMGELIPLGSPVWVWGKFYEFAVRNILSGSWKQDRGDGRALNYWLGMDSGVIDLDLSRKLPAGVRQMAKILRYGMLSGNLDPFRRRIMAQDGSIKNDGTTTFTPEELIHMDWLCENVIGSIPSFEELLPQSQPLVRELGIYRDQIPSEKEARIREDFDHIR